MLGHRQARAGLQSASHQDSPSAAASAWCATTDLTPFLAALDDDAPALSTGAGTHVVSWRNHGSPTFLRRLCRFNFARPRQRVANLATTCYSVPVYSAVNSLMAVAISCSSVMLSSHLGARFAGTT